MWLSPAYFYSIIHSFKIDKADSASGSAFLWKKRLVWDSFALSETLTKGQELKNQLICGVKAAQKALSTLNSQLSTLH